MENDVILENLVRIAHGIVRQFGNQCEVCIHDLKSADLEHTIVYIVNGHVTGRKEGDGASGIVLKTLEDIIEGRVVMDHLGYKTRTVDGRILKSSTIFLKNNSGEVRYLLGINFDITELLASQSFINNFTEIIDKGENAKQDEIMTDVRNLLDNLITRSVDLIGKPPITMSKDEKIRAFKFLKDSGAFLITGSGDIISNYYGISKYTLYTYINQEKYSNK